MAESEAQGSDHLDELLEEAETARAESEQVEEAGHEFQIIRFTTGGRQFAIPIENVRRTERVPPVTPVPRAPAWVRGIASLRGGVVCILDLPALLGEGGTEIPAIEARSLLVVGTGSRQVGILSDDLPDFERIEAHEALRLTSRDTEFYTRAVERETGLVGILDPEKLLDHLEERMANAAE